MHFEMHEGDARDVVMFVRRLRGGHFTFYLNDRAFLYDRAMNWVQKVPVVVTIPPELILKGENVMHVDLTADPGYLHGMPRVTIGLSHRLEREIRIWKFFQDEVISIFAFALFLIGVLSLAFWVIDRSDALFWYGISGVGFGVVTAIWYVTAGYAGFRVWLLSFIFLRYYGIVTPLAIVHMRLAGWRKPWLEASLWMMLLLAVYLMGREDRSWRLEAWTAFGLFYSIVPLFFLVPLARSKATLRPLSRVGLAGAAIGASALCLHDWAARAGILPLDSPQLILYMVPLFMFVIGVVMVERFVAATRRQRETAAELEERVEEKGREIAAAHAQIRAVEEERALVRERRRIMADMHDGLGSRLVGLLSQVQSGKADARQLEEGLTAALEELRTAIDSLQPVEGDLGVVLGNVRHRMRSVFETAGIELGWHVEEMPRMDDLTPARNLAIQRILLELFTNVLKHSGARKVDVRTRSAAGQAAIEIADDGRGFDTGHHGKGRGLANMMERARSVGARLELDSRPGGGTRATLSLATAA